MAASVNKVILIGNLGNDPQVRVMQDGREIISLSIATSESWKDRSTGERKEKTEWHRVIIFNEHLVRIAKEYLRKGNKVYVEGQLQTRKWTDNGGVVHYTTEIVLQNFNGVLTSLDKVERREEQGDAYESENSTSIDNDFELDDEIPF